MKYHLQRFTIYDLVIIAIMAALGVAVKPIVSSLAHFISGPIMIPGGALAGGFYMMWLIVGLGITGKYGTGTLIALVQALMVIFTGIIGSHGLISLISYTLPGIAADLVLILMRHRACCKLCTFFAGTAANVAGTFSVNFIFFSLPGIFLILTLLVAALSGGLGGLIAWALLQIIRKYRLIRRPQSQIPCAGDPPSAQNQLSPEEKPHES